MSINGRIITQLAQDFITAEMQCRPIEPIISQFPHITEAEAYRIQKVVVDLKKERGEQIVGKKVGATSQAIQQFLGVEELSITHISPGENEWDKLPIHHIELGEVRTWTTIW